MQQKPTSPGERSALRLLDWETAEAWQSAYGFSQFHLEHIGNIWTIGRLGTTYFRLDRLPPTEVEAVLIQIDSGRCLLVRSEEPLREPGLREVGVSLRMRGPLEVLT
jgi:hypothetical protein